MVHEMKTKWMFQTAAIITSRLLHPQRMSSSSTLKEMIAHLDRGKCHKKKVINCLIVTLPLKSMSQ